MNIKFKIAILYNPSCDLTDSFTFAEIWVHGSGWDVFEQRVDTLHVAFVTRLVQRGPTCMVLCIHIHTWNMHRGWVRGLRGKKQDSTEVEHSGNVNRSRSLGLWVEQKGGDEGGIKRRRAEHKDSQLDGEVEMGWSRVEPWGVGGVGSGVEWSDIDSQFSSYFSSLITILNTI